MGDFTMGRELFAKLPMRDAWIRANLTRHDAMSILISFNTGVVKTCALIFVFVIFRFIKNIAPPGRPRHPQNPCLGVRSAPRGETENRCTNEKRPDA